MTPSLQCKLDMKKIDVSYCKCCGDVYCDGIFSPTLTKLFCFQPKTLRGKEGMKSKPCHLCKPEPTCNCWMCRSTRR